MEPHVQAFFFVFWESKERNISPKCRAFLDRVENMGLLLGKTARVISK